MIDFRYHLVSIIAVFLALAIGLTVGATALSGPVLAALHAELKRVSQNEASLAKDKQDLLQQVGADQAFAQAGSHAVLCGILAGQKVVLVVAPGADSNVTNGVTAALGQAGATVTGQVNLNQSFLDTTGRNESVLSELAQTLAPTLNVTLPASTAGAPGGQKAAATVLAAALLTKSLASGSTTTVPASAAASALNQFAQDNFVSVTGPHGSTSLAAATMAVLIVPAGPPVAGSVGFQAAQVLPAVAAQLKAAGDGTVMAGPVSAIGGNSAISAENNTGQVSTVDYADTVTGAIMVAQALNFALNGKAPTQYGVGPGTAPSPAPTACPTPAGVSPSASSSPTPTRSTGGHK
ncbi:MAG TPA: copper transporter [Streptosporangiaceae bacterium]